MTIFSLCTSRFQCVSNLTTTFHMMEAPLLPIGSPPSFRRPAPELTPLMTRPPSALTTTSCQRELPDILIFSGCAPSVRPLDLPDCGEELGGKIVSHCESSNPWLRFFMVTDPVHLQVPLLWLSRGPVPRVATGDNPPASLLCIFPGYSAQSSPPFDSSSYSSPFAPSSEAGLTTSRLGLVFLLGLDEIFSPSACTMAKLPQFVGKHCWTGFPGLKWTRIHRLLPSPLFLSRREPTA